MANKEVKVVIAGTENVSQTAKEAEGGLRGFVSSATGLLTSLGAVAAGIALGEFFKGAIAEAQNSREAMGQLELAVNNSGASFKNMRPEIDATLDRLAKMTKFQDDDFARAMQQMTLKTGDAKWALNNLGLTADLAAAAQIDLATAADVMSKAHEGNFKAINKLLPDLKGAINNMDMLAQATNGAAEAQMRQLGPFEAVKKWFGELEESVGRAILGNDQFSESGFGVADMLKDLANWIDAHNGTVNKMIDVTVTIAKNLWESLSPALSYIADIFSTVMVPVLKAAVIVLSEASFAVRALGTKWQDVAGMIVEAVGDIVEKGAALLRRFGINVGDGLATTLSQYGQTMQSEASKNWTKLETDHAAFWQRMTADGESAVGDHKAQAVERNRITKESLDNDKKFWEEYKKALKTVMDQIKVDQDNYKERIKELGPLTKKAFETQQLEAFNNAMEDIKFAADDAWNAIKRHDTLPAMGEKHLPSMAEANNKLVFAARASLDWGDALGIMDDKTKAALNSVINLSEGLTKVMAGGAGAAMGWLGVVGALASLVSSITNGDSERRKLLDANTKALDKLRTDGVSLSNKASGESIGKAKETLSPDFAVNLAAMASMPNHGDVKAMNMLNAALAKSGLRVSDLDKIASDLGMNIRDKNGNLNFDALVQLVQGLQTPGFGTSVGQSFSDQIKFFKETQGLSGSSGAQAGGDLLSFLKNGGVSALNGIDMSDPTKAVSQLFGLRAKLNNGGLDPGSLGRLTGEEFNQLIVEIIGMLQNGGGSGASSSSGTGASSAPIDAGTSPAGVVPKTLADVVTTLSDQTDKLTSYHSAALGYAERTASATEMTVEELRAIRSILSAQSSGKYEAIQIALGRDMSVQRRLAGNAAI